MPDISILIYGFGFCLQFTVTVNAMYRSLPLTAVNKYVILYTATIKVKTFAAANFNMQKATFLQLQNLQGNGRRHALDACRSVGPAVEPSSPPGSCPRNHRQAFDRRSFRSFTGGNAVLLTITGEL